MTSASVKQVRLATSERPGGGLVLLVFGLNLLAFIALYLAMNRHHKNLLGRQPSAPRVFLLCGVVLLDLGLALTFPIHWQGVEIGIVFWLCLLILATSMLVLLLT